MLLRMPRRGAGTASPFSCSGCDGMNATQSRSVSSGGDTERLLFVNASQVVTCAGPARARRGAEMSDAVIRTDVGILVEGERVAAIAPVPDLRRESAGAKEIDC